MTDDELALIEARWNGPDGWTVRRTTFSEGGKRWVGYIAEPIDVAQGSISAQRPIEREDEIAPLFARLGQAHRDVATLLFLVRRLREEAAHASGQRPTHGLLGQWPPLTQEERDSLVADETEVPDRRPKPPA